LVNLPPIPFKVTECDENHPLVKEALRPRKHYEECWCGSGRKFKKCHRFREQEAKLQLGEVLNEQRRIFWRQRGCMHPYAGPNKCSGTIIDSHTIQRKGPLHELVDTSNHVCKLEVAPEEVLVKEIGWRKASTFPGYCAEHDSRIFGPLERLPFTETHEQCVLQAYRSVCNDLYKKRALIESLEYQRGVIDRGCTLDEQIDKQLYVTLNLDGQIKSERELSSLWRKFDTAIARQDYSAFSSSCYFFNGDLSVTSAGALHTKFDFHGNKLIDMWDIKVDAQILCHSIMVTKSGGAIVFVWFTEEQLPSTVVSSFDEIEDSDKGDIFVQYCFLNCENTYFSKRWWENLKTSAQAQLKKYAAVRYYDGGAFVANKASLVQWNTGDLHADKN
jgi:hypothetical protein